jgi:hypothetical protein
MQKQFARSFPAAETSWIVFAALNGDFLAQERLRDWYY